MTDEHVLLTPSEAAQLLGISENTIRLICKNDAEFPCFRIGTYNKISKTGLEEWILKKCSEKAVIEYPEMVVKREQRKMAGRRPRR